MLTSGLRTMSHVVSDLRSAAERVCAAGLDHPREYVSGLPVADKGNVMHREEAVMGGAEQVSNSTWNEKPSEGVEARRSPGNDQGWLAVVPSSLS